MQDVDFDNDMDIILLQENELVLLENFCQDTLGTSVACFNEDSYQTIYSFEDTDLISPQISDIDLGILSDNPGTTDFALIVRASGTVDVPASSITQLGILTWHSTSGNTSFNVLASGTEELGVRLSSVEIVSFSDRPSLLVTSAEDGVVSLFISSNLGDDDAKEALMEETSSVDDFWNVHSISSGIVAPVGAKIAPLKNISNAADFVIFGGDTLTVVYHDDNGETVGGYTHEQLSAFSHSHVVVADLDRSAIYGSTTDIVAVMDDSILVWYRNTGQKGTNMSFCCAC